MFYRIMSHFSQTQRWLRTYPGQALVISSTSFVTGYWLRATHPMSQPDTSNRRKPFWMLDWDNTLCQTRHRSEKRLILVLEHLAQEHHWSPEQRQTAKEYIKTTPWTQKIDKHMQYVFGEPYAKEASQLYLGPYLHHPDIPEPKPTPNAEKLLVFLKKQCEEHDGKIVIISNGYLNSIQNSIKHFGWSYVLEDIPIVTAEQLPQEKSKPHPAHFYEALALSNIDNEDLANYNFYIVGDGWDSDIELIRRISQELPMGSQAHAYWYNPHDRSEKQYASFGVQHIDNLLTIIDNQHSNDPHKGVKREVTL